MHGVGVRCDRRRFFVRSPFIEKSMSLHYCHYISLCHYIILLDHQWPCLFIELLGGNYSNLILVTVIFSQFYFRYINWNLWWVPNCDSFKDKINLCNITIITVNWCLSQRNMWFRSHVRIISWYWGNNRYYYFRRQKTFWANHKLNCCGLRGGYNQFWPNSQRKYSIITYHNIISIIPAL